MAAETIREKVKLAFNPATSSPEMQEVFANPLSRTLWLAIRPGHLVAEDFPQLIIKYAKIIKKDIEEGDLTAERLFRILSGFAAPPTAGVIGFGERDFAKELLSFVKGEREIAFEINAN